MEISRRENQMASPQVDKVARAICKAEGWNYWPLDLIEPDSGDEEMVKYFYKAAEAAIEAMEEK
jgi:hypothetical protein